MERAAPTEAGGGARRCPDDEGRHWFRAVAVDVGSCLLVAVVLTAMMMQFWERTFHQLVQALLLNWVISLGIGLTIANLYRFVFPAAVRHVRGRWGQLLHGGFGVVAVLGGGEVSLRVLQLIGYDPAQIRLGMIQIGLVVVAVILGFTLAYERLKAHARTVELREHEARQTALRAQLDALQARTDPHFLFNTLNTVAGLIDEDPRTAERMLERLSAVFRYALSGSSRAWVCLEDELQAVRDYLAVEQIRFGDRLTIAFDVDPATKTLLIPPLVLQPLVENAVLHGVAPRTEGGSIRVEAARRDGMLALAVEDDGPGFGRSAHRGSGTSLENLRERLKLVYGERATLETVERERGGCRAGLLLPLGGGQS